MTSCLYAARLFICSLVSPSSLKSTFTLFIQPCFGIPFLLSPIHIINHFPTCSSSVRMTCPYNFFHALYIFPTFVVPIILSFLILSIFVTPHILLNVLISATSIFLELRFLRCQCLATVHHCRSNNSLVHISLHSQADFFQSSHSLSGLFSLGDYGVR